MLRAILFDCDGVIADTEPVHFKLFQEVLAEEGISLSESQYYEEYVGMRDKECFEAVFVRATKSLSADKLVGLIQKKHHLIDKRFRQNLVIFKPTIELIHAARKECILAVVSGGLRKEIEQILEIAGITDAFQTVIAAEDVPAGKPDPAGYLLGLQRLGVHPKEAIGIEDTIPGIQAVQGAGMKCVALANGFSSTDLKMADLIFQKGETISLGKIIDIVT